MKKIFYFIPIVSLVLIGLYSCQKDLKEAVFLELSDNTTIEIPSSGGQKSIGVRTNYGKWVATPNVDWIQVNQEADAFTITVGTNKSPELRKGEVFVYAEGDPKRVLVEQLPGEGPIFISREKVEVDQFENTVEIKVKSTFGDWSLEGNLPEWISALRVPGEDILTLTIHENTHKTAREHKVFVKNKYASEEILVTQSGIMRYILPYLTPGASSEDVKVFEEARKSVLQIDAQYQYGGAHTYVTKSQLFRTIKYGYNNKNLFSAVIEVEDVLTIIDDEFITMLEEEGFKFVGDNNVELVYVKETQEGSAYYDIVANISYNPADKNNYKKVTFRIIRGQKMPHPTYKEIPLGLGRFDVSATDVTAWESTHGGKMSKSKSTVGETFSDYFYDVYKNPYVIRRYIFDAQDNLLNMHIFLYDVNKMFYSAGENKYILTREFKKLLVESGFTELQKYDDPAKQFDLFYKNPDRKIAIACRVGHYAEVNDGVPVAHILVIPI